MPPHSEPYAVAVLADAHFHSITGNFGDAGLVSGGMRLALRSWNDTRAAARAFNETASVLDAALQKIAALGVRHVVFAGDYTDDGQAENTRCLTDLLQRFEQSHGLKFFAIPGNHDLYGPHGKHVTTRFVSAPGKTVVVTSDPDEASRDATTILTPAMRCLGQPEALLPMARFGLFRQPDYLHWESPFGVQDHPDARMYDALSADGSATRHLMDASYLVEPEAGLWLLMLDANVFEPRAGSHDPKRKKAFLDPSDAGWNSVLRVKPFLLDWIASVTARAATLGKTLITVSHYPVLDPFQDRAGSEQALFGQTTMARRTPALRVGQTLAAAGLRVHVGGHMHVNATTRIATDNGPLTDVSLPSLVAFPPAFKIIHARSGMIRAKTITLDDVLPDARLSALYASEGRAGPDVPFGSFLAAQRRVHLLERCLPRDWPQEMLTLVAGKDAQFLADLAGDGAEAIAMRHGLDRQVFADCTLQDLITDAYLVKSAGPLAKNWISASTLSLYRALAADCGDADADPRFGPRGFFRRFLSVMQVSLRRMDADDTCIMPEPADVLPDVPEEYPSAG